jgi:rhodanese-related sulfurtransferase
MDRYLWIVVMVAALAFFYWMRRPTVSSSEARRLVEAGARLLDVRSPMEFAGGHLEGALNIPVDQLSKRLREVGPTSRPVIVYCASGMRSASAVRVLKAAGWADVRNLGSMNNW